MKHIFLPCFTVLFTLACAHVSSPDFASPCRDSEDGYACATKELTEIYEQDQKDREDFLRFFDNKNMVRVLKRDEERRVKVAKLFARGCLKSAADYKNAAMIFQHGTVPEHFFQAYTWAEMAVRLGDLSAQSLANLAADRFLVRSGYKQLFGSQATKPTEGNCWCLYQVERTFSDEDRLKRKGKPLREQIEWLNSLNQGQNCPNWECALELKTTSKADFLCFW